MSHDSHTHTNPNNHLVVLQLLKSSEPSILPYCVLHISHKAWLPFHTFFKLLTALSAITGVSLFYHMHPWFLATEGTKKRHFFSLPGRCWLFFILFFFLVFRASLFSFSPHPPAFHPPAPLRIGEEPRQENQRGPSDLTDSSLADVCSFVDIFQQTHWASIPRPHFTNLKLGTRRNTQTSLSFI